MYVCVEKSTYVVASKPFVGDDVGIREGLLEGGGGGVPKGLFSSLFHLWMVYFLDMTLRIGDLFELVILQGEPKGGGGRL